MKDLAQGTQGQAVMTTYSQSYEEQATEARQALEKAKRQVAQQERALTQAQNQARNITNEDLSSARVMFGWFFATGDRKSVV